MSTALFSRLAIVCPGCDQLNPAGASRCTACGADLFGPADAAVQSAQPAPSPPRPPAPAPAGPPASPLTPQGPRRRPIPVLEPHESSPASSAAAAPTPILLKNKVRAGGTPFMLAVVAGPRKGERFRLAPHTVIGRS